MAERTATVTLAEGQIQWLEQAVLDRDAGSALEFLREWLKPRVDAIVNRPRCKPAFELERGEELRPPGGAHRS
jgi:hypothetical protein